MSQPDLTQLANCTTVADLANLWSEVEQQWDATTRRARRLPPAALHERVDGEWSFVETLRHLVFATDGWIRRAVLDTADPNASFGLPHGSYPDEFARSIGVDRTAAPSIDEVLAVRAERQAELGALLARASDTDLAEPARRLPGPGYPDEGCTVRDCIATVLEEEIEHHRYATRDLDAIEHAQHLAFAKRSNGRTWELLDLPERSEAQARELVEAAYASAWHWRYAGDERNEARGEWLLSRAHAVVGDGPAALRHGERCWALTERLGLTGFDRAYAIEARYRAHLVLGDTTVAEELYRAALSAAEAIDDPEDRSLFLSDLG